MGRPFAPRRAALLAGAIAAWSCPAVALDPTKAPAQYVARAWQQSDDGLPQNFVGAIAQTPDGYLWLTTQEGLVRFDGVTFTVTTVRDVPELRLNDLSALAVDRDGAMWVGTVGGGLARRAAGAWRNWRTQDGLPSDIVLALHPTKDGALWIGTRGGGAARLENGAFTRYGTAEGLAHDVVTSIAELADGGVAFGTENGVSILRAGQLTTLRSELSAPSVHALLADADGTLWIGTEAGLDRLQAQTVTSLAKAGGPGDAVESLARDREGNLWIGERAGLHRLSSQAGAAGSPTPLGALSSLDLAGHPLAPVTAFHEDTEGNLWIGTHTHGLARLQDGKVTTFGTTQVWSLLENASGALWLGGGDGLYSMRGDALERVPDPTRLSSTNVWSLADDGAGGLLLGTEGHGVVAFRDGRFGAAQADARLDLGPARSVYRDRKGTIWIGLGDGVARVDGGHVTRLSADDGVIPSPVNAFTEAPDGRLFVAMDRGVLESSGRGFVTRAAREPGSTPVLAVAVDDADTWVGTFGGGLELVREGRVVGRVTTRQGLWNDVVYAMVDDGRGEFWMTCNKGIFHASKRELVEVATGARPRVASSALGTTDGMRSGECNSGTPGALRTRDGLLWFPTTAGAVRVDPAHLRKNVVVPPVQIERVEVDRAPLDLAAKSSLPAGAKDFAFTYTALSFTAPERVRFKYRLEGFDRDWVDAGPRRVAYYTNLAPGSYRFRVIAANDDGVWNETGDVVSFRLAPRFYQTLPFYLACALALMLAGAGTVRLRLLQLRRRARMLEQKVEERTAELAKANDDLQGAFKALAAKDARLHEDLLQAQAFQQRILPRLPARGPLRFRALYKPADLVGGDVYDVSELPDGRTRVFMADTTGHGVQASLRTMVLKTEYERLKASAAGPGEVLTELNEKLSTVYPGLEMRCSALCFDVAPRADGGADVRFANAAHPPLLRTTEGAVDEIYAPGTFLGILGGVTFKESEESLDPGDVLVAYTDGICEQEDAKGHAFGIDRMKDLLGRRPDADGALKALDGALATFLEGRPLEDDVAIVCVECAADRLSREVAE